MTGLASPSPGSEPKETGYLMPIPCPWQRPMLCVTNVFTPQKGYGTQGLVRRINVHLEEARELSCVGIAYVSE